MGISLGAGGYGHALLGRPLPRVILQFEYGILGTNRLGSDPDQEQLKCNCCMITAGPQDRNGLEALEVFKGWKCCLA